jgi:hypothetical protein
MKISDINTSPIDPTKSKTQNNAERLLERLKSPLLHIASKLPQNTKTPHSHPHVTPSVRQLAAKVENLSGGRFVLARDEQINIQKLTRFTRLKIYDTACGHVSWLSEAQMHSFSRQLDRWCCLCGDPLSFEHIGNGDKTSIQRFVEIRSGGRVFFSWRNNIEDSDMTNIFIFNCITCGGQGYETPFIWFLRDSKPGMSTETNGCSCCEQKLRSN